ncbi:hypothetical protein LDENG_00285330, partial [Lucifuga dentata]
ICHFIVSVFLLLTFHLFYIPLDFRVCFHKRRMQPLSRFIFKGPYHPFYIFESNILNFHSRSVTDNHFLKHTNGAVN